METTQTPNKSKPYKKVISAFEQHLGLGFVEITLVHLGMYLEGRSPGATGKILRSWGTKLSEGRSSGEEEGRRWQPGAAVMRAGSGGIRAGALPPVPACLLYLPLRPDYPAFARGGLSEADNPALAKSG